MVPDIEVDVAHDNRGLAYDYGRWYYDKLSGSLAALNSRLGTLIALSGVVLRFAVDMPDASVFQVGLRRGVVMLGLLAVLAALLGLRTRIGATVLSPTALLDKFYYQPDEQCRMAIVRCWEDASNSLEQACSRKLRWLEVTVACLALAALCFGLAAL